jgi:hypothetical protein
MGARRRRPQQRVEHWRDVQALIVAIQKVDAAVGRAMATVFVHALSIDPFIRDLMLDRIAQENTTEGLLFLFRAFSAWRAETRITPGAALTRIPVHANVRGADCWRFIAPAEIAYAVVGKGVEHIAVSPAGAAKPSVAKHVYVRTASGFWRTPYRSIGDFLRRVDPGQFVQINNGSIALSVKRVSQMEASGATRLVEVAVSNNARDTVMVSRRSYSELRRRLGLPQRRERRTQTSDNRPRSGR